MILKEFDLDIPLFDKDKRHKFRTQIRCIASHYQRFLPKKFQTVDFWKILVECVKEESDTQNTYLGVRVVRVSFDYPSFEELDDSGKKILILNKLHTGVLKVAKHYGFDNAIFNHCYERVKLDNCINNWIWNKPKSNITRKLKAHITCSHDINKFTAKLFVLDKNGTLIREDIVFEDEPNEFVFANKLGTLKWITTNEVALYNKSKHCIYQTSV